MFERIETEFAALPLPPEWSAQFKMTLLKIYGDKCLKDDKTFEVFAFTYPTEALLIVSYTGLDEFINPTTLFLSTDLLENTKPEKALDILCDSVGIFFDHYFATTDSSEEIFDEYVHHWEEEEVGSTKIYYKITRENIGLTLQANQILGE